MTEIELLQERIKLKDSQIASLRIPNESLVIYSKQVTERADKLEEELAEEKKAREEWEGRTLARNQPCGCVICICGGERCAGCGSRPCNSFPHGTDNAVWEKNPLLDRAEAAEKINEIKERQLKGRESEIRAMAEKLEESEKHRHDARICIQVEDFQEELGKRKAAEAKATANQEESTTKTNHLITELVVSQEERVALALVIDDAVAMLVAVEDLPFENGEDRKACIEITDAILKVLSRPDTHSQIIAEHDKGVRADERDQWARAFTHLITFFQPNHPMIAGLKQAALDLRVGPLPKDGLQAQAQKSGEGS